MKQSRFFIAAGALTLGIVSIFGTKPDKKFAYVTSGKFQVYSGSSVSSLPNNTFTDTKTGNSVTVILATISGTKLSTLVTSSSTSPVHPVYLQIP